MFIKAPVKTGAFVIKGIFNKSWKDIFLISGDERQEADMRLVGVKSLKPGNILAEPVTTSSGRIILNSEVELTEGYIRRLLQTGIHKVFICDERFEDVIPERPFDLKTWESTAAVLKGVYDAVHSGRSFDEFVLREAASKIVDGVRDSFSRGVSLLSTEAIDEYVIEHSINVAVLSAFMANRMDFNYNGICDIVVGALIHDIGRENKAQEDPDHIKAGFNVMRHYRGISLHSSIVCYEHHENYDGSGYPRKLKDSEISKFTRVIRVADFYDYLLHGYNDGGEPLMPHQAYESLLAASGSILDPSVVEQFRDTIIFYPNGCMVELSNGLKGIVVKQNPGSPQRPVVRVLGETDVIGEIDLFKSLSLFVKDVLVI